MERLIEHIRSAGSDPWILGIVSFLGASFAGLTTQLRNGKVLTYRSVSAAMMNSGFIGVIIFLTGYQMFSDNLPYLIGLCLLAGIGGATMLDFIFTIFKKKSGLTITIKQD